VEVIDTEVPGATVGADGAADIVDGEVIEDEDVVEGEVIEADEMTDEDMPEGGGGATEGGAPGADDTQTFDGGNRRTGER